jgi:N-acetylglucosaminyl-diphospho-decaprenol L-rhamnosyltransferase
VDLSFCVVNTDGREHLARCLAAIRDTVPGGLEYEVLVLDNASQDGSADAVEAWNRGPEGLGERLTIVRRPRRAGKAENDSELLRRARGELCLLLNEDSELLPGAVAELVAALRANPRAGAAGAQLL